jgi:hypothetical protein
MAKSAPVSKEEEVVVSFRPSLSRVTSREWVGINRGQRLALPND